MPPRAARALTLRALNRATLARQLLLARAPITPLRAIEQLAGLQAQLPRPPFIGLWSRLERFRREDLIALYRGRRAVRATMIRGTIHLLSARDYLRLRAPIQPALDRMLRWAVPGPRDGFDPEALISEGRAFFERGPRTFEALRAHLASHGHERELRASAYAVRLLLPLVVVPGDGRWGGAARTAFPSLASPLSPRADGGEAGRGGTPATAFTVAEAFLGKPVGASTDLSPLIRRYLAAFGPATAADAQVWSGIRPLKDAFEALRAELVVVRDERGRELFDLPDAPRPPEDAPAPVRLLPEFDNLVLSHADRSRVIGDDHRRAISAKNGMTPAMILVDGFVAGTWRAERRGRVATLALTPFRALSRRVRADIEAEAEPLLRFIEEDAQVFEIRVVR